MYILSHTPLVITISRLCRVASSAIVRRYNAITCLGEWPDHLTPTQPRLWRAVSKYDGSRGTVARLSLRISHAHPLLHVNPRASMGNGNRRVIHYGPRQGDLALRASIRD